MRGLILGLSVLLTTACVSTESLMQVYDNPGWPGYISISVSEFDGRKMIDMEPAYLSDASSLFRLGLRWDSRFPDEHYMLLAEWGEAENFSPDGLLQMNVDGQFISLKPVDMRKYGVVSTKTVSSNGVINVPVNLGNMTIKQYWITESELKQIIQAKKVVVRVSLLENYWEEKLEPTADALPTYEKYPYIWAKAGFEKFLKIVTTG